MGSLTVERPQPSQQGEQAFTIYTLESYSFCSDSFSDFTAQDNLLPYLQSSPDFSTDTMLTR
jgi:hypothetical protein